MARITPTGLSGLVGTVVTYNMNGVQYVRSKPSRHKKKRKNNPINVLFRDITVNGSPMLKYLKRLNHFSFPLTLWSYNHFRGWLRNMLALHSRELALQARTLVCTLNQNCEYRDIISVQFEVKKEGQNIIISVPEFNPGTDIRSPSNTRSIKIIFLAVSSKFDEPCVKHDSRQEMIVENSLNSIPANEIVLAINAEPGNMIMVAVAIEFRLKPEDQALLDLKWKPSAVIAIGRI